LKTPIVLTIAGSDSSGGAGIQADIKTLSALGVYSASVITSVTAQNTCGVQAVHELPSDIIESQLNSVFNDLNIDVVKIGMLNTKTIIEQVAQALQKYRPKNIVLDPVMISSSGKQLLNNDAINTLKSLLLPMVTLLTPNIPEAAVLVNSIPAKDKESMKETLLQLAKLVPASILLKGGHLPGDSCTDLLLEDRRMYEFSQTKISTMNTHGTGCTLSSAIAAYLALGIPMQKAVGKANNYLHQAILNADQLNIGRGQGPVHHFYHQW